MLNKDVKSIEVIIDTELGELVATVDAYWDLDEQDHDMEIASAKLEGIEVSHILPDAMNQSIAELAYEIICEFA